VADAHSAHEPRHDIGGLARARQRARPHAVEVKPLEILAGQPCLLSTERGELAARLGLVLAMAQENEGAGGQGGETPLYVRAGMWDSR
jgi:hypothetical protein